MRFRRWRFCSSSSPSRRRREQTVTTEWQPIETAPKDGRTIIILGDALTEHAFVDVAFWDAGEGSYRAGPGWFFLEDLCQMNTARNVHGITHWQPLPSPPTRET